MVRTLRYSYRAGNSRAVSKINRTGGLARPDDIQRVEVRRRPEVVLEVGVGARHPAILGYAQDHRDLLAMPGNELRSLSLGSSPNMLTQRICA